MRESPEKEREVLLMSENHEPLTVPAGETNRVAFWPVKFNPETLDPSYAPCTV